MLWVCKLFRSNNTPVFSKFSLVWSNTWHCLLNSYKVKIGFLSGASGKEPASQCRRHERHGFNPWIGKIPWRRAWQPTPVFLPEKSHGQRRLLGYRPESQRVGHNLSDLAQSKNQTEGSWTRYFKNKEYSTESSETGLVLYILSYYRCLIIIMICWDASWPMYWIIKKVHDF